MTANNKRKTIGEVLNTPIRSGKYAGKTIGELIEYDPGYLIKARDKFRAKHGSKHKSVDTTVPDTITYPPSVIPGGKYKGKDVVEVVEYDRNYVKWLAEKYNGKAEGLREAAITALA